MGKENPEYEQKRPRDARERLKIPREEKHVIEYSPGIETVLEGIRLKQTIFQVNRFEDREVFQPLNSLRDQLVRGYLVLVLKNTDAIQTLTVNGIPLFIDPQKRELAVPLTDTFAFHPNAKLDIAIVTSAGEFRIRFPKTQSETNFHQSSVEGYPFFREKKVSQGTTWKPQIEIIGKALHDFEVYTGVEIFDGIVLENAGQPSWGKYFAVGNDYLDGSLFQAAAEAGEIPFDTKLTRPASTELLRLAVRHEGYHKLWAMALPGLAENLGDLQTVPHEAELRKKYPALATNYKNLIAMNQKLNEESLARRGGEYRDIWEKPTDFITFIKDSIFFRTPERPEGHPDKLDDKLVSCAFTLENLDYLETRLRDIRHEDELLFQHVIEGYQQYLPVVLQCLRQRKMALEGSQGSSVVQNQYRAIEYLEELFAKGRERIEKLAA